jgi:hypothetical protein
MKTQLDSDTVITGEKLEITSTGMMKRRRIPN